MAALRDKVAWVTGAGSGIGAAAAVVLAREGAAVVLTGRRAEKLEEVAAAITSSGGTAEVQPGDLTDAAAVQGIADHVKARFGRLDVLVNNAGLNVLARDWARLSAAGVDEVVHGNLSSAYYCVIAALPMMRAQRDGVLIHTASIAGLVVSPLAGTTYTAAKHGVVAMSHSINMEECVNNIRSCVICPGEVATPILDRRPVPVSAEERALMAQPEDVADLIRYVACLPPHICLNQVTITPTHNRGYLTARGGKGA